MPFDSIEEYNDVEPRTSWGYRLVFTSTCSLALLSLFAPSATVSIYLSRVSDPAVDACQIILCCASALSLTFIGLYLLAARRDEAVGSVRPPSKAWHNPCFVTLRITVIFWLMSAVATMVIAFKSICTQSRFVCILQKVEGGCSCVAFALTIVILSLLERCHKPFNTPRVLNIKPRITCRVSTFADDLLLERSVSRGASFDAKRRPLQLTRNNWTDQYSLPRNGIVSLIMTPEQQEMESQYAKSPELERNASHRVESWGSAWTHLATETGCKSDGSGRSRSNSSWGATTATVSEATSACSDRQKLKSSVSNSSMSSAGDSWTSASTASTESLRVKASPSSSISNSSRRSKLSFMRSVESPEVAIKENLRFHAVPGVLQPDDFNHLPRRRSSLKRPHASLRHLGLRRNASDNSLVPPPLNIRRHDVQPPRSSSMPSVPTLYYTPPPRLSPKYPILVPPPRPSRRNSAECLIPGAFEDDHTPPSSQAESLDIHTRMIEDAIFASASTAKAVQFRRENSAPLIVTRSPRAVTKSSSLNNIPNESSIRHSAMPLPLRIGTPTSTAGWRPPNVQLEQRNHPAVQPVQSRTLLSPSSRFQDVDTDGSYDEKGEELVYKRIVTEKSPRIPTMNVGDGRLLWDI